MDWIPWAEFNYNMAVHTTTKTSPFETIYGVPLPRMLSYVHVTSRVQVVDEYLRDKYSILRDLRHNLEIARNCMKVQVDQHRREVNFFVGDFVYLN